MVCFACGLLIHSQTQRRWPRLVLLGFRSWPKLPSQSWECTEPQRSESEQTDPPVQGLEKITSHHRAGEAWDGTTPGLVLLISGGDGDSASGRGRMWEENQALCDAWRLQKLIQKDQRGARSEWQGVFDP